MPAFADDIAAAAGLLMQKDAGTPVVVIRNLHWSDDLIGIFVIPAAYVTFQGLRERLKGKPKEIKPAETPATGTPL